MVMKSSYDSWDDPPSMAMKSPWRKRTDSQYMETWWCKKTVDKCGSGQASHLKLMLLDTLTLKSKPPPLKHLAWMDLGRPGGNSLLTPHLNLDSLSLGAQWAIESGHPWKTPGLSALTSVSDNRQPLLQDWEIEALMVPDVQNLLSQPLGWNMLASLQHRRESMRFYIQFVTMMLSHGPATSTLMTILGSNRYPALHLTRIYIHRLAACHSMSKYNAFSWVV